MDLPSRFAVIVKPKAGKTELLGFDSGRQAFRVAVKARPEHNEANLEIVRFFSKLSGRRARIVRGLTSREKTIALDP